MWDAIYPYVTALVPTIGVATLFYFIMKYIIEGDRRERLAHSQWEAEQAAKAAASPQAPVHDDIPGKTPRNGDPNPNSSSE